MGALRVLFKTPGQALLTFLSGGALAWLALEIAAWILKADWRVVQENLRYFLVGRLPKEETWRAWVLLALGLWLSLLLLARWKAVHLGRLERYATPLLLLGALAFLAVLLPIPPGVLSGLLLSLVLSLGAMALAFPLGLALALARQSRLGGLRLLSIVYIEVVRGVPLISVLFLAFVTLPLFLPEGFRPSQFIRALVGYALFAAAYLAENVRGGLQAVPRGQVEAALSLGLSPLQVALFVVLPQALRAVIPAIVGQFIALFKDTSLVAILGLLDLLGMAQAILANPKYLHLEREVYAFLGLVYLLVSGALSYLGRSVERALSLGRR